MTSLKAIAVGLMFAVLCLVVFPMFEFAVKYAYSVAASGGVGNSPGAAMAIPSPLSVLAAIAAFVYGFRKARLGRAIPL